MLYHILEFLKKINRKFILLLIIFLAGSFELLGLSLVYPVIYLLFDINSVQEIDNNYLQIVLDFFNYDKKLIIFSIVLIIILKFIFLFIYNSYHRIISFNFQNKLREDYFESIFKSKYNQNLGNSSAILNSLTNQSKNAQSALTILFKIVQILFITISLFFLGLLVSKELFFCSLILELIVFFIFRWVINNSKKISKKLIDYEDKYLNIVNQSNSNYKYIKISETNNFMLEKIKKILNKIKIENLKFIYLKNLTTLSNEPILLIILISIFYIGLNILNLNISTLLTTLIILYRFNSQIFPIFGLYQSFRFDFQSYIHIENELLNLKNNIELNKGLNLKRINSIKFNKAIFGHNKILFQVNNLVLKKNKLITLKGVSGSGKSTLVDTLLGINKLIDGKISINDKDHKKINIKSLRKIIGYLGQDNALFNDTIFNNINLRSVKVNQKKLTEMIKDLDLAKIFKNELIDLQFVIKESKENISGGEKQRLAFIREIMHNPELLIIDEAFNSLDSDTLKKIKNFIIKLKRKMIIINIAHHEELTDISDNIYKIENKKLIKIK